MKYDLFNFETDNCCLVAMEFTRWRAKVLVIGVCKLPELSVLAKLHHQEYHTPAEQLLYSVQSDAWLTYIQYSHAELSI